MYRYASGIVATYHDGFACINFNEVQNVYILMFLWSNSTTSFVTWKNVQLNDSPKCLNLLWDAPKITNAQVFQFLKFCHKCYVDFFGKLKPMLTNNSSPICNLCNSNKTHTWLRLPKLSYCFNLHLNALQTNNQNQNNNQCACI